MQFTIHDVGHGFCAHLLHDNGNVMLWDCGHKSEPEYVPSKFLPALGIQTVNRLIITNYDEDHISDLPDLRNAVDIEILRKNGSITSGQLRNLKEETGPISPAMESLLSMLDTYTGDVTEPPSFPNVTFVTSYCQYPTDFQDTNNLSVVSFLRTPMCNVVIPGDLEEPAWEKLLRDEEFRDNLRQTDVFVASHHGRTNGYHEDVFEYCSPSVVVFSDGPIQHATQEEAATYANHASGINFNGEMRYVLTTRNDGTLTWNSN